MVGQHINLAADIPTDLGVIDTASETWTVGGERVKSYTQNLTLDHDPAPPNDVTHINTSVHKVDLTAADLVGHPSVALYWTNGSFTGTTVDVTFTVKIGNDTYHLKGKVKVFRPRIDLVLKDPQQPQGPQNPLVLAYKGVLTDDNDPVHVGDTYAVNGTKYDDPYLSFGAAKAPNGAGHSAGILYGGHVTTPPNLNIGAGSLGFIQLGQSVRRYFAADGTQFPTDTTGANSYLDAPSFLDPNNPTIYQGSATTAIGNGDTQDTSAGDLPNIFLDAALSKVSAHETFTTYLMYKPQGGDSIWVTLGVLTWHWSGTAKKGANGWYLDTTATTDPTQPGANQNADPKPLPQKPLSDIQGQDSTTLPEWDDVLQNFAF